MAEPLVIRRRDGGILHLTLNDPDRKNPLSDPMIDALNQAITSADARSASVIVLRGAGDFFSAGGDIKGFREALTTDATEQFAATREFRQLFIHLDALEAITVAVVTGQALGGGCGLAAACNIVIAAESARFGCPEVNLGAFPMVITPPLVRAIGARATLALASRGKRIDARRAQQLGLVTEVLPDEDFAAQVDAYLGDLARVPGNVLRLGKLSVRAAETADYRTAFESGSLLRALLFAAPEFHYGVDAFFERARSAR